MPLHTEDWYLASNMFHAYTWHTHHYTRLCPKNLGSTRTDPTTWHEERERKLSMVQRGCIHVVGIRASKEEKNIDQQRWGGLNDKDPRTRKNPLPGVGRRT
jgi:hypothetical protein